MIKLVLSIFLYFFQESFIFKPEKLFDDFILEYENQEVEEYNIQLNDKVIIIGPHFKTKKTKGVVFYLKALRGG